MPTAKERAVAAIEGGLIGEARSDGTVLAWKADLVDLVQRLADALEAARAKLVVPEGWWLVPEEPTKVASNLLIIVLLIISGWTLIYAVLDVRKDLDQLIELHYTVCPYAEGCDKGYE